MCVTKVYTPRFCLSLQLRTLLLEMVHVQTAIYFSCLSKSKLNEFDITRGCNYILYSELNVIRNGNSQ